MRNHCEMLSTLPPKKLESVREALAIPSECIAINAGSWGPLCRPAIDAMREFDLRTHAARRDWASFAAYVLDLLAQDRAAVARVIGADPHEIALCETTTQGISIILWGLDLRAGDEIVYSSLENPAAEIALWSLARRLGLRLRCAELGAGERPAAEAFGELITPRTRAFVASHVNYLSGATCDLAGLSELAHRHDVFLLVDGVQAIGTLPVDVHRLGVDGYAIARHKFLCGPDGAGALYLRGELLDRVKPNFAGVCSTTPYLGGPSDINSFELQPTAERFELCTRAFGAYAGGRAALDWLTNTVGLSQIHEHIRALRRTLWRSLSSLSHIELISEEAWDNGLLALRVPGLPAPRLVESLASEGILTRAVDLGQESALRLSLGFWNTRSDVERIEIALRSAGTYGSNSIGARRRA